MHSLDDIYIYEFQYLTIITPPVKLNVIVFIIFSFYVLLFGGKLRVRIDPILRTIGV